MLAPSPSEEGSLGDGGLGDGGLGDGGLGSSVLAIEPPWYGACADDACVGVRVLDGTCVCDPRGASVEVAGRRES